jgi:O-glycosyl hydrolase
LPDVEVFASDNNKNIVVVNKSPSKTHSANVRLIGQDSGSVTAWQKSTALNPSSPPANMGTVIIEKGMFSYSLPPYSVTTFVVN